ncbi:MAG: T9SS type A sorting domain-containing protein [Chitinophagales bacterium]
MTKYFFLLFTSLVSLQTIFAQQNAACGTQISETDMQAFYNRVKPQKLKGTNSEVYIPITYHIVSDNNGNGGYTLSQTFNAHCNLNENFLDADVVFYIKNIIYHNSDNYYYMLNGTSSGNDMFLNENDLTSCNIYIVRDANTGSSGNLIPVCGYSYLAQFSSNYLNRNGIVLDQQCAINDLTTLTHEMGHYLNLPHTFSGWENRDYNNNPIPTSQWERADGSNCASRGDGFCDTPPDYISTSWDCVTTVSFDDAVGQNFIVDEKNYMSYSNDNCHAYFKPEQQAEVNAAASSYRTYLLTNPAPDLSPVAVANTIFPPDNITDLSAGSITFTWAASAGAEAYLVEFTQGNFFNILRTEKVTTNSLTLTDLAPNSTYKWRVKAYKLANVCSDYSSEKVFSTGSFNVFADPVDVFCPGDENGTVTINSDDVAGSYSLNEYDSTSQTFNQINITTSNTFSNLAPNDYFVTFTNTAGDISKVYFNIADALPINIQLNVNLTTISSAVSGGAMPYNYIWSNGDNSFINYNPSIGENSLYITDANGCFKAASAEFEEEDPSTNIKDINKFDFSLFPNPISGNYVFIQFSETNIENASIELYTISGKKVKEIETKKTNNIFAEKINISNLTKGVYFIKITAGKKSSTRKVIL